MLDLTHSATESAPFPLPHFRSSWQVDCNSQPHSYRLPVGSLTVPLCRSCFGIAVAGFGPLRFVEVQRSIISGQKDPTSACFFGK